MATCKPYFDTRSKTATKFPLKVELSHKSKQAYIPTQIYLTLDQWNTENKKIVSIKNSGKANSKLKRMLAITEEVIDSLGLHVKEMNVYQIKEVAEQKIDEELKERNLKQFSDLIQSAQDSEKADYTCLYEYANDVCKWYYTIDKGGSARSIDYTVKNLKKFTKKTNLPFVKINQKFIEEYERWYLKQLNYRGKLNTINGFGFRAKDIRILLNLAIKDKDVKDVTVEHYCFGKSGYSIKRERTDNRNIDPTELAKIYQLQLEPGSALWHHQNYFKYYFECWGMNWTDIAFLRVYQVKNGRLIYRRRKTKWSNNAKTFDIKHSPLAQQIIDFYTRNKKDMDFVFPILDKIYHLNDDLKDKDQESKNKKLFEKKFGNKRSNHIRRLSTLSKKAGLSENISIYVARHSFFSIALREGVSKSTISELAGHADYRTTESYLAGFDNETLSESAEAVTKSVNKIISLSEPKSKGDIYEFLDKLHLKSSNRLSSADIVIELLKNNMCENGIEAQKFADKYLTLLQNKHSA